MIAPCIDKARAARWAGHVKQTKEELKVKAHEKYLRVRAERHSRGVTSNGAPWKVRPVLTFDQSVTASSIRFWSKVDKSKDCWEWRGGLNRAGYGKFKVGGRTVGAHRIAYILKHGTVASSALVCHTCDNPKCVRHDHLFLGTSASNMADKVAKGRQARGPSLSAAVKANARSPRGSQQGGAKLVEAQIPEIRALYASGMSCPKIGARFGITGSGIWTVVSGKTWRHVS